VEAEGTLSGRAAIVTGASKGIGRAVAVRFAGAGARVTCVARSGDLLKETVDLIESAGGDAFAVVADLSKEADVERMVHASVEHFGHLDCLVNNAGDGGPTRPIQEYPLAGWEYTISSCLTSTYLCARFAVPAMLVVGRGAIVNISSMAGRRGLPFRAGYCAAKAGQIGLTYGLAVELGRHNITVNAIAPGAVTGDRIERAIAAQAEIRGVPVDKVRKSFEDRAPLQRMTSADDIAALAVFLCSDSARNISGQCVPVNGGEPAS
jgi:NAD(P)-dependent dehydrogenase (short-subunit alcohol dehydrogenase family)